MTDRKDRNRSVLELALRRGGVWKGARATETIVAWALAERALGHPLGLGIRHEGVSAAMSEYAEYWKISERTAWRELHRFREVFPEEESPARLARLIAHAADSRSEARAALADVPLSLA